jgi:hypothetical protein
MDLCAAPIPHRCKPTANAGKTAARARQSPAKPEQPKTARTLPKAQGTARARQLAQKAPLPKQQPTRGAPPTAPKSLASYARDCHCELLLIPVVLAGVLLLRRRRCRGKPRPPTSDLAYPLPAQDKAYPLPAAELPRVRPKPCVAPPPPERKRIWDGGATHASVHDADAAQAGRDAAAASEETKRQRAVAESENEFIREFEALLEGGLDVDVRPSDEWRRAHKNQKTVEAALLSLGKDTRGRARCAWTVGTRDSACLVSELRCVGRPLPGELGELSARSFIINHDGDSTLIHCPSEDLADLCVAGFNLLADREAAIARTAAWKGKTPSAKKALGDRNLAET